MKDNPKEIDKLEKENKELEKELYDAVEFINILRVNVPEVQALMDAIGKHNQD